MAIPRPTIATATRVFAAVGSAGVAWVTVLTTLESEAVSAAIPEGGVRLVITLAAAVTVGVLVWLLASRSDNRSVTRDAEFARAIRDGNQLINRCDKYIRRGGLEADPQAARLALIDAWRSWEAAGGELVRKWGTAADVESYTRADPSSGDQAGNIAKNVSARIDRLEQIVRSKTR